MLLLPALAGDEGGDYWPGDHLDHLDYLDQHLDQLDQHLDQLDQLDHLNQHLGQLGQVSTKPSWWSRWSRTTSRHWGVIIINIFF